MLKHNNHPFHLVDISPWPICMSLSLMGSMLGFMKMILINNSDLLFTSLFVMIITSYQWWRDVIREGTFQGMHTLEVKANLKSGMGLFIISEILFFFSFFWAYFYSSLSPTHEIGLMWPPLGIIMFNPLNVPLLGTVILLYSGLTVTWSHHNLILNKINNMKINLLLTIIMGICFTTLQGYEYLQAPFSLNDGIFGSLFFIMTGFHGIHVIIGTLFLLVCLWRVFKDHFSMNHHFGFEAASWYWHFVDVVWLFLYLIIYWWGK
nr:cytochrome c oxidase subunit III [Peloridium hammoniorum]